MDILLVLIVVSGFTYLVMNGYLLRKWITMGKLNTLVNTLMAISRLFGMMYICGVIFEKFYASFYDLDEVGSDQTQTPFSF